MRITAEKSGVRRVDEPGETAGEILNKVSEAQSIGDTPEEQRLCPRCSDVVMMRHYFSPRRQVMVDECPQCGGCWLDAGELAAIRREKQEENEFRQAVEDYLARISPSELRSLLETARHRYGAPGKRE